MTSSSLAFALVFALSAAAAPPPPPTPAAEPAAPAASVAELGQSAMGGAGLNRVRSGFIANRQISLSLRAGFYRAPQLTLPAGTDEYRSTLVSAAFSPLSFLEISAMLRSVTVEQPASPSNNYWLVNDFFLKLKAGGTFADGSLALAGEFYLRLPPPIFRAIPVWQGMSPGFGLLFSYDFRKAGVPLVFHANGSFFLDQSVDFDDQSADLTRRSALDIVTFNQLRAGTGLEGRFAAGSVGIRPFVEYTLDAPLGATGPIPMRLSPGVRVLPWRGLFLDGLVELGLTKVTQPGLVPVAPWQLQFALGWQMGVDPVGGATEVVEKVVEREKLIAQVPTTGKVQGLVVDITKTPIAEAVVQIAGRNRILTDADGRFVIDAVEPGPLKVVATHPGYEPREQSGTVDKGGVLSVTLTLPQRPPEPPKPMAVRGTVLNETEKPIVATVSVAAAGVAQKSSETGEFALTVPAGETVVEVSSAGYLTQARRLTGSPGDALVVDFLMRPVPKQTLVVLKKDKIEIKKQVHFATNRDVILPDSAPLLDQIAATILEYDKLKLIRIEGHSDDQGDDAYNLDLSNRRAKAISRALMERGVEATRLKPVGYGETKPVADNKKPAGRALNRRVEFMIEQQDD